MDEETKYLYPSTRCYLIHVFTKRTRGYEEKSPSQNIGRSTLRRCTKNSRLLKIEIG